MTFSPDSSRLDPLLNRIRKDARLEADRLLAEADAESEGILEQARSEAEAEVERMKAEARYRAKRREDASEAEARRRLRFRQLEVRHRLLDRAFEEARKRVRGSSKEDFVRLAEALLLRFCEPGDLTLVVGPEESRWLDEALLGELQQKLEGCGSRASIQAVEERADLGGGIVLREGARELDLTLTALFEQIRQNMESELADELFPEEEKAGPAAEGSSASAG